MLVLYLTSLGLSESQAGVLFTLTLFGDTAVSLYLTTRADRFGRRRMLVIGAALMAAAGLAFAATNNFFFLVVAGTIGVISPSGGEVGPFLSIEQAALAHIVPDRSRTEVFAWYTLAGSLAAAFGSLAGGLLTGALQKSAVAPVASYRAVVALYAAIGLLLALLFARLSPAAEIGAAAPATSSRKTFFGVGASRNIVLKLSALFAVDSFSGGFVMQSFAVYWFYLRFGANPATLGVIFFWANLFAGLSALLASRIASRFGLVNTMVFTHIPSSLFLIAAAFSPSLILTLALLLLRAALSQMDVPTRTSYVMAVVTPGERTAAASITAVPRSLASSLSPALAGVLLSMPFSGLPLVVCGVLKVAYDFALLFSFRHVKPPEEKVSRQA